MEPREATVRIGGVDAARAFAALSVALAHIVGPSLPGPVKYLFTGAPAVTAFFVISGFCIHIAYVNRPLPTVPFWLARAIRLGIPVAVAMALAAIVGVRGYNLVDGYILWSVVCEAFYYALYPALLLASRYVGWRWLWVASMVAAYGFVIASGSDQYGNVHVYGPWLNWIVGLPSWLLGCILAETVSTSPPVATVRERWAYRIVTAGSASILIALTLNTPIGLIYTLNLFAVLVMFWLRAEVGSWKADTIFDGVGRWSYSIYLVHVIVANALVFLDDLPPVVFAAALVGSYLFYLLVERPSHRLARRVFAATRSTPLEATRVAGE